MAEIGSQMVSIAGFVGKLLHQFVHESDGSAKQLFPFCRPVGIAIDFKDLKRITNEVLARVDHTYINEVAPFDKLNPTSENIARWLHEGLDRALTSSNVRLVRIDIQENDTSRVSFFPD